MPFQSRFRLMLAATLMLTGHGLVSHSVFAFERPRDPRREAIEAFQKIGYRVKEEDRLVFIAPTDVADEDLVRIPDIPIAFGLHFGASGITETGLQTLSHLRNLASLSLVFTKIHCESDCGFENMENLTELSVLGSTVTDIGLKQIAMLPQLQTLDLRKTRITGPGLMEFAEHKRLRALELDLTDEILHVLSKAQLLHILPYAEGKMETAPDSDDEIFALHLNGFYNIRITDHAITALTQLPNLRTLNLTGSDITDAGIHELAKLPHLSTLSLEQTKVTDSGMEEMSSIKTLLSLNLDATAVTDAGLHPLADNSQLIAISLNRTRISDAGVRTLTKIGGLMELSAGSTNITLTGLKELSSLRSLTTLRIHHTKVSDVGLKEISKLPSLITLDLVLCDITDIGLKELRSLTKLGTLHLNRTPITDVGLKELRGFTELSTLSLSATQVTDAGLAELVFLRNLKTLVLYGTPVTIPGIEILQQKLPECEVFY